VIVRVITFDEPAPLLIPGSASSLGRTITASHLNHHIGFGQAHSCRRESLEQPTYES
jgi:hypothetical protein